MRSSTPKVLHPLCGRPMLLHVLDALGALPLERIVVVVGHGAERVTKTCRSSSPPRSRSSSSSRRVQRGTGDAASVALTAFADDPDLEDDVIVMPGDAPLRAARDAGPAGHRAPRGRRRGHAAHRRARRPRRGATAGSCATTRAGSTASSSRPTPTADELEIAEVNTVDLLLPAQPARAGAAAAQPRERAGRVLPDRRGGGAARGRPPGAWRSRPTTPPRARHVNDRAQLADGRGRCCASASTSGGCIDGVDDGRPGAAPTSTPPSSSRPTCGCCPARSSKAAP